MLDQTCVGDHTTTCLSTFKTVQGGGLHYLFWQTIPNVNNSTPPTSKISAKQEAGQNYEQSNKKRQESISY